MDTLLVLHIPIWLPADVPRKTARTAQSPKTLESAWKKNHMRNSWLLIGPSLPSSSTSKCMKVLGWVASLAGILEGQLDQTKEGTHL